ncbi:MAG: methionine biosynthesis protein MetW [Caulobacteraceae bacterium]|nr:methionine biosynthesis protein MetW [Caulobacteraceae bacterium]
MNIAAGRPDFQAILGMVRPGSRVLDVGCGSGDLLHLLTSRRRVDGRGIEISADGVSACLARGLSVMQGDADRDLDFFPERSFDYAILSQTLQAVQNPRHVLGELLRIGERAIVSFPNFAHWRVRLELLRTGRMPVTGVLPDPWWATANIHLCTLADFTALCGELGLAIEMSCALAAGKAARRIDAARPLENWRAESGLFLLRR